MINMFKQQHPSATKYKKALLFIIKTGEFLEDIRCHGL